jgi:hypothetical protein
MDSTTVYVKTAKGREEIEKRTDRLDYKRRTVLILVDGASSVAALSGKAGAMGDPLEILKSLQAGGYIEAVGPARGGTAAPAAANAPLGKSGKSLPELRRIACGAVERYLGPDAVTFALKLEKAATPEEFFVQAGKTRDALRSFLGPKKANEFWASLGYD